MRGSVALAFRNARCWEQGRGSNERLLPGRVQRRWRSMLAAPMNYEEAGACRQASTCAPPRTAPPPCKPSPPLQPPLAPFPRGIPRYAHQRRDAQCERRSMMDWGEWQGDRCAMLDALRIAAQRGLVGAETVGD
ncbi:hypothetical protein SEVIR_1G033251v4 [Setaria viridis]